MAIPKLPDAYEICDIAIKQLNKNTIRLFARARTQILRLGFDELNVISTLNVLYAEIDKEARKKYKELFIMRYLEVIEWVIADRKLRMIPPTDDALEELAEMELAGLLSEPNATTHYSWDAEILRKRDKAIEAINSVSGSGNKQDQLAKHQKYMAAQEGYYADFTSQSAEIRAYKDAGVKRVQRHEMNDSKVCADCKKDDGKIYSIDSIPPLTHLHCRRWFTPVYSK